MSHFGSHVCCTNNSAPRGQQVVLSVVSRKIKIAHSIDKKPDVANVGTNGRLALRNIAKKLSQKLTDGISAFPYIL
jgi:hypothetical protein